MSKKAAKLKVVADNPEPMDEHSDFPRFPDYLPEEVKDVWETTCAKLKQRGTLSDEVLPVVESYVIAVWDQRDAIRAIQKDGRTFSSKGEIKKNPAVSDLKAAREEILRFATALGLTPAEMAKLGEVEGGTDKGSVQDDGCPVPGLAI